MHFTLFQYSVYLSIMKAFDLNPYFQSASEIQQPDPGVTSWPAWRAAARLSLLWHVRNGALLQYRRPRQYIAAVLGKRRLWKDDKDWQVGGPVLLIWKLPTAVEAAPNVIWSTWQISPRFLFCVLCARTWGLNVIIGFRAILWFIS